MGGLGKTARKLGKKVTKIADPVGYKIFRKSGLEKKMIKSVDKYVYGIEETDPPKLAPVAELPDDEALDRAQRRRRRRSRGRASTILSDELGG